MPQDKIVVVGARENNLKNITVEIPRDKLVVITGLSGSGKSSLAFDTIYAEGQRRYVESLSSYARQFLGQLDKPDVDHIEGLSPAVSIDQKSASRNPRSTVGTVTEIYDYLRILFARAGIPYCPNGHGPIERQSTDQIVDAARKYPEGTKLQVLAPLVRGRKGEYKSVIQDAAKAGYVRVRVDGEMYEVTDDIPMDRYKQHTIEVIVDRLVMKEGVERRLADSVEAALKMSKGLVTLAYEMPESGLSGLGVSPKKTKGKKASDADSGPGRDAQATQGEQTFSESYACAECGFSMSELEPRMFSFNSPYGACPTCTGLGTQTEFDPDLVCPDLSKSLRNGAIVPFVYKSGEVKDWWPEMLDGVGRSVGFDSFSPVNLISEEGMNAVWFGVEKPIDVIMHYGKTERVFQTKWDGVLAALKKRYESTESEWVKRDLEQYQSTKPCPVCKGQRLKPETLSVRLPSPGLPPQPLPHPRSSDMGGAKEPPPFSTKEKEEGVGGGVQVGTSIATISSMSVDTAQEYFTALPSLLSSRQLVIGERAVKEISERLTFLKDVGLGYLTLDRNARTLAGGEAQRIRLATQIGSGLMGCLYILDEPSIGLHQRDNRKLIETLQRLRDLGNTVIVVEHDEETMRAADWLIDIGPGAGEHGGEIINEGPLELFLKSEVGTARWLNGLKRIEIPKERRKPLSPCPLSESTNRKLIAAESKAIYNGNGANPKKKLKAGKGAG